MPTLAPKLPWQHAFAGGYPGRSGQSLPTDPDAIDYLNRVAAADGAAVEVGIAQAIEAFIVGCKADSAGYAGDPTRSNWDAIQASCVMCGARTLSGALVPLKAYGPELWADQTPTITNGGGCVGAYDSATRTIAVATAGTESTRPRFDFPVGATNGVRYRLEGRVSGDLSKVWRIFYGNTVVATGADLVASGGVFSKTVTSVGYGPQFYLDATLGTSSVTIESISVRVDNAPTPYNFASGDYSRSGSTPGLKGNGTTKGLDTNRAGNADGQNDSHMSVYATQVSTGNKAYGGVFAGNTKLLYTGDGVAFSASMNGGAYTTINGGNVAGLLGCSRSDSANQTARANGASLQTAVASVSPVAENITVFSRSTGLYSDARLAFYSVGSSLSLSALDTRVTNLVTAIRFHTLTGLLPNDYDPATIAYITAAYAAGGTL